MSKKIRNFFIIILVICFIAGSSIYFYNTYNEIEITPEYEIQRTSSTEKSQTVEKTIVNIIIIHILNFNICAFTTISPLYTSQKYKRISRKTIKSQIKNWML